MFLNQQQSSCLVIGCQGADLMTLLYITQRCWGVGSKHLQVQAEGQAEHAAVREEGSVLLTGGGGGRVRD